jgi:hypothetical protein
MSGEKNFFARWSRRKRGAVAETIAQPKPEKCDDALVPESTTASLTQASPFDAADLPAIDSIGAGSDIRAFLEVGVPADLTRAALRRVWLTDPAIRNFVGLSENSWDFNAPGAIPGFGSIDAESAANMVTRLLGEPDAIATAKESLLKAPHPNEDALRADAPVEGIPTELPSAMQNPSQVRLAEPSVVDADEAAPQNEATTAGDSVSCERAESKSRRNHGGALPQLR